MDMSDDFIYATLLCRGVDDDSYLVCEVSEKQRDLCLADIYYNASISSVKTGTQGESDGGWTHYVAIKNSVNRAGLLDMAKALYDKWDEPYVDTKPKVRMKSLYDV